MMDIQVVLKRSPLFSGLSNDALVRLAQMVRKRAVKGGSQIFAQGDPCGGFYLVAEGSVKIYRLSPNGREHVLAVAHPGQSFGEAAVFSGKAFPAFTEALEDSLLLYLEREEFLDFVEQDPQVVRGLLTGLSGWLMHLVRLLEDTALAEVDIRLVRYLLRLLACNPLQNCPGGKIALPMQKQVLASHLATTPPTLSRAFSRLEEEDLIRVNGLEIEILDLEGLREKAEDERGR